MFGTVTVLASAGQFTLMWRDAIVVQSEYRLDTNEVNASEFAADYGVAIDASWELRFANGMSGWNGRVVEGEAFLAQITKRNRESGGLLFADFFEV